MGMEMRIIIPEADIEAVYEAIYAQLRTKQTLPFKRQLAEQLHMELQHIDRCLGELRRQGRVERTTCLPSDYRNRWREMPVIHDGEDTIGIPLRRTRRTALLEK
jgi:DNA-binding transcriptional MocR family regulator